MTRVTKLATAGALVATLVAIPAVAVAATSPDSSASAQVQRTPTATHPAPAAVSRPGAAATDDQQRPIVVQSGQHLALGSGYTMWLTATAQTVELPDGTLEPHPINLANQPSGVSEETYGPLVSGIYVGGGTPAWVRVDDEGHTYTGPVVELTGAPGWASFYAMTKGVDISDPPGVTVYSATNQVLASFTPPTTTSAVG